MLYVRQAVEAPRSCHETAFLAGNLNAWLGTGHTTYSILTLTTATLEEAWTQPVGLEPATSLTTALSLTAEDSPTAVYNSSITAYYNGPSQLPIGRYVVAQFPRRVLYPPIQSHPRGAAHRVL